MSSRRDFIKRGGLAVAGISLARAGVMKESINFSDITYSDRFVSKRPPLKDRKFVSDAVEEKIRQVASGIRNTELAWIFANCYPNTLDTTVNYSVDAGKPDTFVITGDINAMWLRDSSAQVWPYLPLAPHDAKLKSLLAGVINRQNKSILIDPYANAFNFGPTGSEWDKDLTDMKPELHERKWEIDSLCYPIRLAYGYWKTTGETSCFDDNWKSAMKLVLNTFKQQQRKDGPGPYKFERVTARQSDTVAGGGYGNPIRPVGLVCSMFRPSDDATIFPFLIPSNLFAALSLEHLSEMSKAFTGDIDFANSCLELSHEIRDAVSKCAIVNHPDYGEVYSYEVDGFGNHLFMDDANVPSILSLPYLGCVASDEKSYLNTRALVLSDDNPYFSKGKAGEGIGSPHTGLGKIWPIGVIMRAITSRNDQEISDCLKTLVNGSAGTGFMHESFDRDDAHKFTRSWFAWANTLFGEMIIDLYENKPHLLKS